MKTLIQGSQTSYQAHFRNQMENHNHHLLQRFFLPIN